MLIQKHSSIKAILMNIIRMHWTSQRSLTSVAISKWQIMEIVVSGVVWWLCVGFSPRFSGSLRST